MLVQFHSVATMFDIDLKHIQSYTCDYNRFVLIFFYYIYMWLEFYRHTKFCITARQRAILIIHYSPTLRHLPARS